MVESTNSILRTIHFLSITIADLNGDSEPDFINPTIAYQQNSTDSAGGTSSNFFLNYPTSIQVTLSDGSGGR